MFSMEFEQSELVPALFYGDRGDEESPPPPQKKAWESIKGHNL